MDSIKKNRMRLIPGVGTYWGDIAGNISEQTDLVDYIRAHGGGSAVWGSITGNLSEQVDLMEKFSSYALLSDIPSLDGYATESWVSSQGFLTSEALSGYATESWVVESLSSYALLSDIPSLDGYATESWVSGQGYLTSSALSGYATESWVSDQGYLTSVPSGYATQSWVESQDYVSENDPNLAPLFSKSEGYLMYEPAKVFSGSTNEQQIVESADNAYIFRLVTTIGNDVYFYDIVTMHMFKFNFGSFKFDDLGFMNNATDSQVPLWADSRGRMYYGNQYMIDLENNEFIYSDLGGDVQIHTGSGRNNLVQRDGVTYLISKNNSCAYIFNEETQSFDSSIPITNSFPNNNYYRYLSEFNGHWIYDAGSTQTELVFHLDEAEPYVEWVTLENRLFPGAWTYEYEDRTVNETTRGVFIHPVVKNGVTDWYTFGYATPVMYKLVNGAWQIVDYNQTVSGMSTNAGGCACGTLWFGFGYTNPSTNNGIIIWNLDTNDIIVSSEVYGWDNQITNRVDAIDSGLIGCIGIIEQLETRVGTLEESYGDALSITNEILG